MTNLRHAHLCFGVELIKRLEKQQEDCLVEPGSGEIASKAGKNGSQCYVFAKKNDETATYGNSEHGKSTSKLVDFVGEIPGRNVEVSVVFFYL